MRLEKGEFEEASALPGELSVLMTKDSIYRYSDNDLSITLNPNIESIHGDKYEMVVMVKVVLRDLEHYPRDLSEFPKAAQKGISSTLCELFRKPIIKYRRAFYIYKGDLVGFCPLILD